MQEVHNLFNVRNNLKDLLIDRKYNIPEEFENFSIKDASHFLKKKKNPNFYAYNDNIKIFIKFILFEHIRPNLIKDNIMEILSENTKCRKIL